MASRNKKHRFREQLVGARSPVVADLDPPRRNSTRISLLTGLTILLICFVMLLPATWLPNEKLRNLHTRAQPHLSRAVNSVAVVFGAIFTSGAIWNYVRWHKLQDMARSSELSVIE